MTWIETVIHADPDRGSGAVEIALVALPVLLWGARRALRGRRCAVARVRPEE